MAQVRRLASLAFITVCFFGISSHTRHAIAQPAPDQERRAIVLPLVRTATDCITANVGRQTGITARTSDSTLREAIRRVIGSGVCDGAIDDMIGVYDHAYGPRTGSAFFSGPYGRDLPRAVRSRLVVMQGTEPPAAGNPGQTTAPSTAQTVTGDRQRPSIERDVEQSTQPTPAVSAPPTSPAPTGSNQPRPKTPAEIEAEKAFRAAMGNVLGIFALAGCATFVLFLIGLGSRWVVFLDNGDFVRTGLIIIVPIVTALAIGFEAWRLSLDHSINMPLYDFLTGQWTIITILTIGALAWLWGFAWTLFSSIMANGLVMGLAIAILKITSVVCISFALFGTLYLGEGKEGQYKARPNLAMWIVFGIIIWFASKLINGHRVNDRREARQAYHSLEAA